MLVSSDVSLRYLPISLRKRRNVPTNCSVYTDEISNICKNSSSLDTCNSNRYNSFMNNYTNQSVSWLHEFYFFETINAILKYFKLQTIILSKDPVFSGLFKVSVTDVSNIIISIQEPYTIINFTVSVYLIYNSTLPVFKSQTEVIEQVQQAQQISLSKCIFNATVAINSISAPLFITTNVKLNTNSNQKKRQTDLSNCEGNQAKFANVCLNQKQLVSCNQDSLRSFLSTYINETVIQ